MHIVKLFYQFLDIIFPEKCIACTKSGNLLCDFCITKLKKAKPPKEVKNNLFDQVFIAFDYSEPISTIIKLFKYKYCEKVAQSLAMLIVARLDLGEKPLFVPVPLHPHRLKERGFNQSEVLCNAIVENLSKNNIEAHTTNLLIRSKDTAHQARLCRIDRLQNVKEAFNYVPTFRLPKYDKIYLVDDVYTTGATLTECALTLKKHGFDNVCCLVVAKNDV